MAVLLWFLATLGAPDEEIRPAADAPRPLSPQASAAAFQVAADLRIELVASEPLIADPTGIAWDEHGRLLVCEIHGYNLEGYLDAQALNLTGKLDRAVRRIPAERPAREAAARETYGTVKLLQDTDGDGVMDRATVWADRLPPCYGLAPARGGVVVVCAPEILFLADRDLDGRPEIREVLFRGLGVSKLERGVNNPRRDVDNWLYVANGGARSRVTGPRLDGEVLLGAHLFRMRADGSAIEPATGATHTFGLALTDDGDRFVVTTSDHARYAIPLPHRYLVRNPHAPTPPTDDNAGHDPRTFPISRPHPWRVARGADPAWVRFYGERETTPNGYLTSACGPLVYRAAALPERYHGNHFVCEPQQNLVRRSLLERDGAGFRARRPPGEEDREFLASTDSWFRPINLFTGPDGAIYIVDMYREIIEYYDAIPRFLQQQYNLVHGDDRGRIWRLVPERDALDPVPDLGKAATDHLVERLAHPNAWHRLTAQRLLVEGGAHDVVPQLRHLAWRGPTSASRLHALYTLEGLGDLAADDAAAALADDHATVRVHALRLADRWLGERDDLLDKVIALAADGDPRVRLQVALSLGESEQRRSLEVLARLTVEHGSERWMETAILSSLGRSPGDFVDLLARRGDDRRPGDSLWRPLSFVIGVRRAESEISALLAATAALDGEGADEGILERLDGLADGLARGKIDSFASVAGQEALGRLLDHESPDVRARALQVAGALNPAALPAVDKAFRLFAREALDPDAPSRKRLRALEVLASAPFGVLGAVGAELLAPRQSLDLQLAAVDALSRSNDARVAEVLIAGWARYTPRLRARVVDAMFEQENRLPRLLDRLEDGTVAPGALGGLRREQLATNANPAVRERAARLFTRATPGEEADAVFRSYAAALSGKRDAAAGKTLFGEHCSSCHALGGEGHAVGPDLAATRSHPDQAILIDLLRPGERITAGFETYTLVTAAGRIHSGVVTAESATSVTLRRAGGLEETILRRDIVRLQMASQSLMPDDLEEVLRPEQVAGIVAYLRDVYGPPRTTRRREQDDLRLVGAWKVERNDEYSGETAVFTTMPGDHAVLEFEGTAIYWIGAKTYNGGVFEWIVDDGAPGSVTGEVDTRIDGVERFTRVLLADDLEPGRHTLRLVMRSGPEVYIDAFDILTPIDGR